MEFWAFFSIILATMVVVGVGHVFIRAFDRKTYVSATVVLMALAVIGAFGLVPGVG